MIAARAHDRTFWLYVMIGFSMSQSGSQACWDYDKGSFCRDRVFFFFLPYVAIVALCRERFCPGPGAVVS